MRVSISRQPLAGAYLPVYRDPDDAVCEYPVDAEVRIMKAAGYRSVLFSLPIVFLNSRIE
jgi:hypothetical protein